MNEFTPIPKLEKKVRQALNVPAPSAAFSNGLRTRLIARSSEMKPQTFRRPIWQIAFVAIALLAVLFITFNLPGVATALKNLFGYLPGVGPVSQAAPLRILAEPVSVTRDGYTVTVEKILASADKTALSYRISGIPAEAYYQGYEPQGSCRIQLRLPDGTQLDTLAGYLGTREGADEITGEYNFAPIPGNLNALTFWLPCLDLIDHTRAPANWELPLRLAPAPPDLTLVPIIKVEPATATAQPETNASAKATTSPTPTPVTAAELKLEQVIPAPEGYILVGSFALLDQPASIHLGEWFFLEDGVVTDASGQAFMFSASPKGYEFSDLNDPFRVLDTTIQSGRWAIQIVPAEFAWPVTLTVNSTRAVSRCEPVNFEFDTGPSPQVGQEWKLNKDLELCHGRYVHLISAFLRSAGRYDITYTTDLPNLRQLWLEFDGYGPHGGGGQCEENGDCFAGVQYNDLTPSGKLTGILTGELDIVLTGPWQVQWQP
jgi:hypothetical protein